MRILYVALKHDYGRSEQGLSFEHHNFFESLRGMGHDLLYFDIGGLSGKYGREAMNRRLAEVARSEKPDVLFCVLFRDELERETMRRISEAGQTPTVNWFCDDHWRFESLSRGWAPCFNWVVTTAASALPKYERIGYGNVIKSQWACNHRLYRPLDLPPRYDVSFVGLPHGNRRHVIQSLRDAGIRVSAWGLGWENGRLDQRQMIEVFNRSRINLNLSNASARPATDRAPALRGIGRRALSALGLLPLARSVRASLGPGSQPAPVAAATLQLVQPHDQIKGRNFEVPGCGAFLLTGPADNLRDYYEPGEQVVCFEDFAGLCERIRYFLEHEEQRARIARAGYERTIAEHTYDHRFSEIFARMGLPGRSSGGTVEEIG